MVHSIELTNYDSCLGFEKIYLLTAEPYLVALQAAELSCFVYLSKHVGKRTPCFSYYYSLEF